MRGAEPAAHAAAPRFLKNLPLSRPGTADSPATSEGRGWSAAGNPVIQVLQEVQCVHHAIIVPISQHVSSRPRIQEEKEIQCFYLTIMVDIGRTGNEELNRPRHTCVGLTRTKVVGIHIVVQVISVAGRDCAVGVGLRRPDNAVKLDWV